MIDYFITRPDGRQEGPYDETALLSRIAAGKYDSEVTIWFEGLSDWEPIGNHFSLPAPPPAVPVPSCPAPPRSAATELPLEQESREAPRVLKAAIAVPRTTTPTGPTKVPTQPQPVAEQDELENDTPEEEVADIEGKSFAKKARLDLLSIRRQALKKRIPFAAIIQPILLIGLVLVGGYYFGLFESEKNDPSEDLPPTQPSAPATTAPATTEGTTPVAAAPDIIDEEDLPEYMLEDEEEVDIPGNESTSTPSATAATPSSAPEGPSLIDRMRGLFKGGKNESPATASSASNGEDAEPSDGESSTAATSTSSGRKSSSRATEEDEVDAESSSTARTLSPEDKKKLTSLKRRLRLMYKRKGNCYKKIAFYKHKIELHENCRSCYSGHCDNQGITGACRHWDMEPFDGKKVRVCHQLPRGEQRYSGIDQAISSLNTKINVIENTIARVDEKIEEMQDEIRELSGSADAVPEEPEYEYADKRSGRFSSHSSRSY